MPTQKITSLNKRVNVSACVDYQLIDKFYNLLENAVKNAVGTHTTIALAFSGGLDSTLLAVICKRCHILPKLYVAGLLDRRSRDLQIATEVATVIGLELQVLKLTSDQIIADAKILSTIINTTEIFSLSFLLPIYYVLKHCNESVVLCGQGADELFGGYARYLRFDSTTRLQLEMQADLEKLLQSISGREYKIASYFGKDIKLPYLDPEIIEFATKRVPLQMKVDVKSQTRKIILRQVAELKLQLPSEIVHRRKLAAQYGSGFWRVLKQYFPEGLIK